MKLPWQHKEPEAQRVEVIVQHEGDAYPAWALRAGMRITETDYRHDPPRLIVRVEDELALAKRAARRGPLAGRNA
jgi:hypothetical protein